MNYMLYINETGYIACGRLLIHDLDQQENKDYAEMHKPGLLSINECLCSNNWATIDELSIVIELLMQNQPWANAAFTAMVTDTDGSFMESMHEVFDSSELLAPDNAVFGGRMNLAEIISRKWNPENDE